ncbi:MAG: peptide chain release factor N(5)-glutamine methyltransferase [Phycisphaerales bacterium]
MTDAQRTTSTAEQVWTVRRLLAWVTEAFTKRGLDSPKLSGEILLSHVLKIERLRLYIEADRELAKGELDALRGLVARALKDEPVQYLTGEGWFFGLPLAVDRRVLVPRPCTEMMVEGVLQGVRGRESEKRKAKSENSEGVAEADALTKGGFRGGMPRGEGVRVLDLCTGSGCVAVALAKNLPGATVIATDVSVEALEVARSNAARHGVAVEFRQGDLFDALRGDERGTFDFIVSNPPYIPDVEWAEVPANVKNHEPELALRGGLDGFSLVRPILQQGAEWLKPEGVLMVETAASGAQDALKIAEDADRYADGRVVKDLEGLDRFVLVTAR